jgi:hypothetical protein
MKPYPPVPPAQESFPAGPSSDNKPPHPSFPHADPYPQQAPNTAQPHTVMGIPVPQSFDDIPNSLGFGKNVGVGVAG